MTINEKIRAYRKAAKLTQEQLAKKSKISLMSVRRYESGEREPKIGQLTKIADALGVPIIFFADVETDKAREALTSIIENNKSDNIKPVIYNPETKELNQRTDEPLHVSSPQTEEYRDAMQDEFGKLPENVKKQMMELARAMLEWQKKQHLTSDDKKE